MPDSTYKGHDILIDRHRGGWRSVRVPSLGIDEDPLPLSYRQMIDLGMGMIDRHLREHGGAPVRREPMTDEERTALYDEVFGRF